MKKLFIILAVVVASTLLTTGILVSQNNGGIGFTYVPPWGSYYNLYGQVWDVTPSEYRVAVYIYLEGWWWPKPYATNPLTIIADDSTWTCDITTGGIDKYATRIIAFLVPDGYEPPQSGYSYSQWPEYLPIELYDFPYVLECRYPGNRIISFSGYNWIVKQCEETIGPGLNYFSDNTSDVWVDENDELHMKITYRSGKWYCSEVIADTSLGYGKHVFYVKSRVDSLDQNAVLGLFTWDECTPPEPPYNYREMDIEFSRWGEAQSDTNAQYVVQPWDTPGNRHRFIIDSDTCTTHMFEWRENYIEFQSYYGCSSTPSSNDLIESWTYTGSDIPTPGDENPRINLWLFNGVPPSDGEDIEIIIQCFEFTSDTIAVDNYIVNPQPYYLYQNYPNPFNPKTKISFSISKDNKVDISVYTIKGQKIKTLVNKLLLVGEYSIIWNGKNDSGKLVSSGIYFYKMGLENYSSTKKMILLK
ncbi:MAG: T9SS type A sorting domain-containing protein [Candidatus Cloacimonetes bacterium]|nr:T9SS type A sorting domain-containing protein [Candidatus Cloacimonadota bacterium]MCK4359675.1 T9SS type A sorting domain-containing protein [Candidatus Cloacimonadota bacterium]